MTRMTLFSKEGRETVDLPGNMAQISRQLFESYPHVYAAEVEGNVSDVHDYEQADYFDSHRTEQFGRIGDLIAKIVRQAEGRTFDGYREETDLLFSLYSPTTMPIVYGLPEHPDDWHLSDLKDAKIYDLEPGFLSGELAALYLRSVYYTVDALESILDSITEE